MRKNIKKIVILTLLCLTLGYVTNITSIPDKIILFENEKLKLGQALRNNNKRKRR